MTVLLSPVNERRPIDLGQTLFRKQILPLGKIMYKGRELVFDKPYLQELASTFKEAPLDQVPFQLADEDNRHTMDPTRYGGEIKGLEVTKSGLDMLVELTPDTAELIRKNNKLGVSARIHEIFHREADGRTFGKTLEHVLGTLHPRVTGMGAWQEVSLSEDIEDDDIIDATQEEVTTLSDTTGAPSGQGGASPPASPAPDPAGQTSESAAGETPAATPPASPPAGTSRAPQPVMDFDGMDFEDVSDAEIEAAERELTGASLSASSPSGSIELAAQRANEDRIRNLELELARQRFVNEAREYIEAGVPPVLVELARPLLSLPMAPVIDLSNDDKIDMGQLVRDMLDQTKGFIELASERGTSYNPADDGETRADNVLEAWTGGSN
jgi:hypothetical protein